MNIRNANLFDISKDIKSLDNYTTTFIPMKNYRDEDGNSQEYKCSQPLTKAILYDENKIFVKSGLFEEFINSKEEDIPIGSFIRVNFAQE